MATHSISSHIAYRYTSCFLAIKKKWGTVSKLYDLYIYTYRIFFSSCIYTLHDGLHTIQHSPAPPPCHSVFVFCSGSTTSD
jgi:hypothetical protein